MPNWSKKDSNKKKRTQKGFQAMVSGMTDWNLEEPQMYSCFSQQEICWVLWQCRTLEASQKPQQKNSQSCSAVVSSYIRQEEKHTKALFARFWFCVRWAEELSSKPSKKQDILQGREAAKVKAREGPSERGKENSLMALKRKKYH